MKKKILAGIILLAASIVVPFAVHGFPEPGRRCPDVPRDIKTMRDLITCCDMAADQAKLTLITREGTKEVINLKDLEYKILVAMKGMKPDFGNHFRWFTWENDGRIYRVPAMAVYNRDLLPGVIQQLECVRNTDAKLPENSVMRKAEDGIYEIVPGDLGNTVDPDELAEAINDAIINKRSVIDMDYEDVYVKPEIGPDDPVLVRTVTLYNIIGEEGVTIDFFNASETYHVEDVVDHTKINQEGALLVSDAWLAEQIDYFREKYNTFRTERTFVTSDGDTIQVGGEDADTYGFQLDGDTTRIRLQDAIKGLEDRNIEAAWNMKGVYRNPDDPKDDLDDTYVEVSIDEQYLWYYEDGELMLETDVVTGDSTKGRDTPPGVCRVWHKEKDKVLTGPTWSSPVDYWMPFNWCDCGLHDATWRSYFGGDIYEGNGSHGCVNMPWEEAKDLYNMIALNTPVILY